LANASQRWPARQALSVEGRAERLREVARRLTAMPLPAPVTKTTCFMIELTVQ
jgi:hypothetical protein